MMRTIVLPIITRSILSDPHVSFPNIECLKLHVCSLSLKSPTQSLEVKQQNEGELAFFESIIQTQVKFQEVSIFIDLINVVMNIDNGVI